MDQDSNGEKPKPVKIFKMVCVPQGPDMPNRTGQFFGRIQFNRQSQHLSQAISIHPPMVRVWVMCLLTW